MSTEPLLETYGKGREDKIATRGAEEVAVVDVAEEIEVLVPSDVAKEGQMGVQSSWLVIRWGRRKIVDPFLVILRRGLGPKQLSTSAALGITLGVFPVYGVTVLLCAIVVALLRSNCHLPTLMLANLVATPLQLGLVVPFIRLGECVVGGEHFLLTPNALWLAITGRASHAILFGLLHALVGWAIIAPPLLGGLYLFFLPLFRCLIKKFGAASPVQTSIHVSPHALKNEVFSSPSKDPEI